MSNQNRRQQGLLEKTTKEVNKLRVEYQQLKTKYDQREKVNRILTQNHIYQICDAVPQDRNLIQLTQFEALRNDEINQSRGAKKRKIPLNLKGFIRQVRKNPVNPKQETEASCCSI